jgi:hypothetical protein
MVREVERVAVDRCRVQLVGHAGGAMHEPEAILDGIMAVVEGKAPCRADLVASDAPLGV